MLREKENKSQMLKKKKRKLISDVDEKKEKRDQISNVEEKKRKLISDVDEKKRKKRPNFKC